MNNQENNDETYSLIFKSLKHPVRRKILRMLNEGELTFSQILETLAMDSGHLSYHLDNLGDLITRSAEGKYKLSSFGLAATKLMSGVEESKPQNSTPRREPYSTIKIFSVVLTVALLWSSLHSINFQTRTENLLVGVPQIPLNISPNQTYEYNVTITYGTQHLLSTEKNAVKIIADEPSHAFDNFKQYFLRINFNLNTTYYIDMQVHDPANTTIYDAPLAGSAGILGVGSGAFESQGTYTIVIRNLENQPVQGNAALDVMSEEFERPLFYYGLAGIATTFTYPTIILLSWLWMKRSRATE